MNEHDRAEYVAMLVGESKRSRPDPGALEQAEDAIALGFAPQTLVLSTADALMRGGEIGRAWAALASADGEQAQLRRAEIARRRGDRAEAEQIALSLAADPSHVPQEAQGHPTSLRTSPQIPDEVRDHARAIAARIAWDAGDLDEAERRLVGARGPLAAEVRALIAYRRGTLGAGREVLEQALAGSPESLTSARLMGALGMLEHADGRASKSAHAFARAVELAVQAGAVVEEATYLTGLAAAASDEGDIGTALASATRAALLWERLGLRSHAARAWLARASALATVGASHAADEAAQEAAERATDSGDRAARAYARWAIVETRPPGDARAKEEATDAFREIGSSSNLDDVARATARLLVWAPSEVDRAALSAIDAGAGSLAAPSRWEWWGARAAASASFPVPVGTLAALLALLDVPAPLGSRGPALHAAVRLARERGDGDAARRFEDARTTAARALRDHTPRDLAASLDAVAWTHTTDKTGALEALDFTLAPAQLEQLTSIVRVLGARDRLRPLLEQVLDTMVLWSGVERGLLLLRAPDGRLVPRAARNLARRDLAGEQLALSHSLARKAIETGDAVIATDAFSTLADAHASVHALRLRSVLAVPLIARGETLGVVYLDDRVRRGAFGAREIAWVRLVASQAATAIADARDQVLLKRAVRRAERAQKELARLLGEKEAELFATRVELRTVQGDARHPYDAIRGRSDAVRSMLRLVDRVTESDIPVLLLGESGTGKELVARAMHANGARKDRPFVSENCAAVPEPLLESTLFGHVRGAFTGAVTTRAGLFDVADGGTFFLDEVGEMPLTMQTKLLRVLQEGEVRPVGSDRTRKVDVRVICATHRDLAAMVEERLFREDLFYRLNVISVRVPPLRERKDDIPLLALHFLDKYGEGKKLRITKAAMDRLVGYPWPGNVRQLENEMRRAIVLADDRIDVPELSEEVARGGPGAARGAGIGLRSRVDALEAELVRDALDRTRGNQTKAAEMLGLSRFGLQKMMRRLNVRIGS